MRHLRTAKRKVVHTFRSWVSVRLREHPIALLIAPTLWCMIGLLLLRTRLPLEMWPREVPAVGREWVRITFAIAIIASAMMVAAGVYWRRYVMLGAGSSIAFGVSAAILLGVGKLVVTQDFVWPQVVIAALVWGILSFGWLTSLIENKRVTRIPEPVVR